MSSMDKNKVVWRRLVREWVRSSCGAKSNEGAAVLAARRAGYNASDGARAITEAQEVARHLSVDERNLIRSGADSRTIDRFVARSLRDHEQASKVRKQDRAVERAMFEHKHSPVKRSVLAGYRR